MMMMMMMMTAMNIVPDEGRSVVSISTSCLGTFTPLLSDKLGLFLLLFHSLGAGVRIKPFLPIEIMDKNKVSGRNDLEEGAVLNSPGKN
jgi:hypothetical protein